MIRDDSVLLLPEPFLVGDPSSGVHAVARNRPAARCSPLTRTRETPRPAPLAPASRPPSRIVLAQGRHGTLPQTIHAAVLGATAAQMRYLRALETAHRVQYAEEADLASARARAYSLLMIVGPSWRGNLEALGASRMDFRCPALLAWTAEDGPAELDLLHADASRCSSAPDARTVDLVGLRSSSQIEADERLRMHWIQTDLIPEVAERSELGRRPAELLVRHGYLRQSIPEIAHAMSCQERTAYKYREQILRSKLTPSSLDVAWARVIEVAPARQRRAEPISKS